MVEYHPGDLLEVTDKVSTLAFTCLYVRPSGSVDRVYIISSNAFMRQNSFMWFDLRSAGRYGQDIRILSRLS